jgi:hypothetical protein
VEHKTAMYEQNGYCSVFSKRLWKTDEGITPDEAVTI